MTLSEVVKAYRKSNSLTQRELAKRMQVTDMTISRLESSDSARLSDKVIVALSEILSAEELEKVDKDYRNNANYIRIRRLVDLRAERKNPFYKSEEQLMQESLANYYMATGNGTEYDETLYGDSTPIICECLQKIDFERIEEENDDKHGFSLRFANKETEKKWFLDYMFAWSNIGTDNIISFIRHGYGKCCTPEIHKYSIVVDQDIRPHLEDIKKYAAPNNLHCDVSFLLYSTQYKKIVGEVNLKINRDGNGIFDLDILEKKEASQEAYIQWSMMLSGM